MRLNPNSRFREAMCAASADGYAVIQDGRAVLIVWTSEVCGNSLIEAHRAASECAYEFGGTVIAISRN